MASEDILQELVKQAVPLTKCITISTAHMTQSDCELLEKLCRPYRDRNDDFKWIDESWVFETEYGFILQLSQREKRLEILRDYGGSTALCRFLEAITKETGISFVLFDRDEHVIKNIQSFDW